ncbi:Cyclin, N-terminal domain containing protein [Histomonas meleagridis]|uniref:Cyclin, N-terminal domain containing protein n=1 Tax=Histomonas meleagridis TaxID=135588 RepID=UPI00355A2718|nr:Cyclin, N-terminal domain containing protein [Histomonas meleagridis]KAH0803944.1 Cyclin, N-terminal domain containing protein [Histomonas meleagridis]
MDEHETKINLNNIGDEKVSQSTMKIQNINSIEDDDEYSDPDFTEDSEEEIIDIDEQNKSIPRKLSYIANDIFLNAMDEDFSNVVSKKSFLTRQEKILQKSPKMRENIIKYLIRVAQDIGCSSDALFNAAFYINIVLCSTELLAENIQLFVLSCLWLSIKADKRTYGYLDQYLEKTNTNFIADQIIATEMDLLPALSFRTTYPTIKFFVRRFLDIVSTDAIVYECANFFCEVFIMSFESLDCPTAVGAAAAVYSSFVGLNQRFPMQLLLRYTTNIGEEEILEASDWMIKKAKNILKNDKHLLNERYSDQRLRGGVKKMKFE